MVWLAAGPREIVIAVTPQSIRALGQWKRTDRAATSTDALPPALALPTPQPKSPAIAGLVKLREQRAASINEEVATDDVEADALWAREILAATGARR